MKVCIELSPAENTRLEARALKLYGRVHGGKSKIIHDALIAYLEKSTAPPMSEKEPKKGKLKLRISKQPELIARIAEMVKAGRNAGEIAKEIGYSRSVVENYLKK